MSQVYSGYTRGIVQIVPEVNGNNMTNISGDVTIFINLHAIDSLGLQTNYFQSINSIQLKDLSGTVIASDSDLVTGYNYTVANGIPLPTSSSNYEWQLAFSGVGSTIPLGTYTLEIKGIQTTANGIEDIIFEVELPSDVEKGTGCLEAYNLRHNQFTIPDTCNDTAAYGDQRIDGINRCTDGWVEAMASNTYVYHTVGNMSAEPSSNNGAGKVHANGTKIYQTGSAQGVSSADWPPDGTSVTFHYKEDGCSTWSSTTHNVYTSCGNGEEIWLNSSCNTGQTPYLAGGNYCSWSFVGGWQWFEVVQTQIPATQGAPLYLWDLDSAAPTNISTTIGSSIANVTVPFSVNATYSNTGIYQYKYYEITNSSEAFTTIYHIVSAIGCIISDCTDPTATNYNPAANYDCNQTDITAVGYTQGLGWNSCCQYLSGCTDPSAINYDALATIDDGSCIYCNTGTITTSVVPATYGQNDGCVTTTINFAGTIYPPFILNLTGPSGNIVGPVGVTSIAGLETILSRCSLAPGTYTITFTDCPIPGACGTTNCTYTETFVIEEGSPTYGCMDPGACNYDPLANIDDQSCIYPQGCNNWCPGDPGSPILEVDECGECLDPSDPNYNACIGCMDNGAINYNPDATIACDDCCGYYISTPDCEASGISLQLTAPFWSTAQFQNATAELTYSGSVVATQGLSEIDLSNGVTLTAASGMETGLYCLDLTINLSTTSGVIAGGIINTTNAPTYTIHQCSIYMCEITCELQEAALGAILDKCTPGNVTKFLQAYGLYIGLQQLIYCGDGDYISSVAAQITALLSGLAIDVSDYPCDENCTIYDACDILRLAATYANQLNVYNACVDHAEEDFQLAIALYDLVTADGCLTDHEICILNMRIAEIVNQCCDIVEDCDGESCSERSSGVWTPGTSYMEGHVIMYASTYYISLEDNNTTVPTASEIWAECETGEVIANPPPLNEPGWKCIERGGCVEVFDGTGPYPTEQLCIKHCYHPTWDCQEGASCIETHDGSGHFNSLGACNNACTQYGLTYDCIDGTCSINLNGTGQYASLPSCQAACI
jgi:hypothetical protein